MSADTRPIAPAAFASALKDLSLSMLHLKVLEIRNSIAHLQYSNDQLLPFAEGTSVASSSSATTETPAAAEPDQDCVDAIAENLTVIDRMAERIALIRAEVEERGMSWKEFEEVKPAEPTPAKDGVDGDVEEEEDGAAASTNGTVRHSAWTDGTFQTGVIRNGEVHLDAAAGERQQQEREGAGDMARASASQGQGQQAGGSLSDDELRRAMEERMRNLGEDGDEEGMHL